jgi:hypothetical protein
LHEHPQLFYDLIQNKRGATINNCTQLISC